jgi:hypothetical protein
MTGDLQPLDVNFNWPFKAKYREKLFLLKMHAEPDVEDEQIANLGHHKMQKETRSSRRKAMSTTLTPRVTRNSS